MRTVTRLTAWATLLVGYATMIAGMIPFRELPPKRQQLWLLGATAAGALCWVLASLAVRARRRAVLRRKQRRRRYRPWPAPRSSRLLSWVLGFGIAFTSAAALCQGVGPDGAYGAWLAKVERAGGGVYEVSVRSVVGTPRPVDNEANDNEYSSTVITDIPFSAGKKEVTLHDVVTRGLPEEGRTLQLRYAPDRPGLGVRQAPETDIGFIAGRYVALPVIWTSAVIAGFLTGLALRRNERRVRRARRFEPWVHLPAAALLLCGAVTIVPLLTAFPTTATGWSLAVASAATPWLALAWVTRTR